MTDRLSSLAGVASTRRVLQAHGLATKKALGQHFLINDGIVKHICALAEVDKDDVVLEIGPGIGTLTVALLQKAAAVVAIERDADLPPVLAETCAPWADIFYLISGDALQVMPADLPTAPDKLVANLPYAVAATLVLDCFQRFQTMESATVMVQAEVADRMAAVPGTKDYGAFTVKLGLYAGVAGRFPVSPGNFFPPPRVNSSVIRLDRALCIDMPESDRHAAVVMADAAFANRRKTILNSCRTYFSAKGALAGSLPDCLRNGQVENAGQGSDIVQMLAQAFSDADIDPRRRGESLSLAEFRTLGRCAREIGLI